jgi:hypothetical protein
VPDEKPPVDRAFELLVYAPIGALLYARDMLPSMVGIFVSRGRREVDSHRAPSAPPPPPMPASSAPRKLVEDGLGMARTVAGGGVGVARDVAGTALSGLLSWRSPEPGSPSGGVAAPAPPGPPAAAPTSPATQPSAPPRGSVDEASGPSVETLPIPDYDELSASQVVERLEGLDRASLDAIRRYEGSHRGRNTILGKISQLG